MRFSVIRTHRTTANPLPGVKQDYFAPRRRDSSRKRASPTGLSRAENPFAAGLRGYRQFAAEHHSGIDNGMTALRHLRPGWNHAAQGRDAGRLGRNCGRGAPSRLREVSASGVIAILRFTPSPASCGCAPACRRSCARGPTRASTPTPRGRRCRPASWASSRLSPSSRGRCCSPW